MSWRLREILSKQWNGTWTWKATISHTETAKHKRASLDNDATRTALPNTRKYIQLQRPSNPANPQKGQPAMSRTDTLPTTARSIALLLSSAPSVQDAHPAVLHQLLEFSHRYTTQVLTDASIYAEHAGRGGRIDQEDVTLGVQARVGWEFGGRVPKEVGVFCFLW